MKGTPRRSTSSPREGRAERRLAGLSPTLRSQEVLRGAAVHRPRGSIRGGTAPPRPSEVWRTPMIVPSLLRAVTSSSSGRLVGSPASDSGSPRSGWGRPAKSPSSPCSISDVFPCTGPDLRPVDPPPKATPMHWWPRQTPKTAWSERRAGSRRIETPASSGVPGPGDMTTASGSSARRSHRRGHRCAPRWARRP